MDDLVFLFPQEMVFFVFMLPCSGAARGWTAVAPHHTLSSHPTNNGTAHGQDQGPHGHGLPAAEVD